MYFITHFPLFFIRWCSTHYKHHLLCDLPGDPHSPVQHSLVYAHASWLLDRKYYGFNLENLRSKYPVHEYPELYLIELFSNAIALLPIQLSNHPYLCLFALTVSIHLELSINSICHFPAKKEQENHSGEREKKICTLEPSSSSSSCHARDVWWIGVLNGGEGFHGAHHDRPKCAHHGRYNKRYNLDIAYLVICSLERLGLCWCVEHDNDNGVDKDNGELATTAKKRI